MLLQPSRSTQSRVRTSNPTSFDSAELGWIVEFSTYCANSLQKQHRVVRKMLDQTVSAYRALLVRSGAS